VCYFALWNRETKHREQRGQSGLVQLQNFFECLLINTPRPTSVQSLRISTKADCVHTALLTRLQASFFSTMVFNLIILCELLTSNISV
jgi:hypothetical protein